MNLDQQFKNSQRHYKFSKVALAKKLGSIDT